MGLKSWLISNSYFNLRFTVDILISNLDSTLILPYSNLDSNSKFLFPGQF